MELSKLHLSLPLVVPGNQLGSLVQPPLPPPLLFMLPLPGPRPETISVYRPRSRVSNPAAGLHLYPFLYPYVIEKGEIKS